jgi:hypothetical protein
MGEPNERIDHPRGSGRERIVGKELEQVGEPSQRLVPSLRRGERRPFVGCADEHGVPELELACGGAERVCSFHDGTQHERAARVGDHVELEPAARQGGEQHRRVLLRRAADGEVIEGEDSIAVDRAHLIEEVGIGEFAEGAVRIGKRAVQEQQRSAGAERCVRFPSGEGAACQRRPRDAKPPFGQPLLFPGGLFPSAREFREHGIDDRIDDLENGDLQ